MQWFFLFFAGLFEIVWAVGLKYTAGFTRFWPSTFTITSMIISVALLAFAVKTLPLGTAYAIWVGIGAVGTVLCGIILLGESASPARLICVGLILAGVVGLKLTPSQA